MKSLKKPTYQELEEEVSQLKARLASRNKQVVKEGSEKGDNYLSNVLNSIGDPVFVKDEQSRLLNVNDAFCRLFGLGRTDIIGKTLAEDVSREEGGKFLEIDKEVLAHGVENISEETITVRNGQTQKISTRKTRFIDSKGKKYLVGIIHDMTQRNKAMQELNLAKERAEEFEERFRLLILNMEAGVVVHAPDTSIIENNKLASEILGLSDDQLKGKTAIDPDWRFVNIEKEPLPLEEYPVNRIASTKAPIKNQISGIYQPDTKDIRWLTINGFPVLNQEKEIIEIVTIFIDITEQKRNAEEKQARELKLKKTQEELRKAQKLSQLGSWIYNPASNELKWSEEMFYIWGFDQNDGVPKYDPDIINRIHPEDLDIFNSTIEKSSDQGTPYDIKFRICIPNEEQKIIRSVFQPAHSETGELIVSGTNQDITAQKLFEKDQIKHQRLKAIGEMSSSIAHDFNNALQEMIGNLEVIKLQNDLTPDISERLGIIESIIKDTAGRVSALQKFGTPESDNKKQDFVDFNFLIQESIKQSRPLWKDEMEKEGFLITVETDLNEIPKIRCNSGELKSVIFNLIKNSIEAMPQGGDLIIHTDVKDNEVHATFTDTGLGMDSEAKMKLFEPFFTTKGYKLGRGLGMSGAYSIVKKYGGNIVVTSSEKNEGTTIEVTFPVNTEEKTTVSKEPEVKKEKTYRVLWVDDDFIITRASRLMVKSLGHECTSVNSGKKALEYLEKNECDLVFTDIGMPKMNGWELAEAIKAKFADQIKVIAVTGWNMKEKVQEENSIDLFLHKPFALADLENVFLNL